MPIFSRISARGFRSSPLIVLSKRLKLTRDVLVGHCLGRPQYAACRFQILFSQHFASIIELKLHNAVELHLITKRRTETLHRHLRVHSIRLRCE